MRSHVLATAGEALAGPGDIDARLRAVEATAATVADRCTISLEAPGAAAPGEVVAPLLSRGEQLGTLTLAARRELGADDRVLAAELAQRCAAAVDSARLVAEADEAYGVLDAVFARAPVGLGLYDRDLRLVRINDHLAEINGLPAAEQIGRPVTELRSRPEGRGHAHAPGARDRARPVRGSRSPARRARPGPVCSASSTSPTARAPAR